MTTAATATTPATSDSTGNTTGDNAPVGVARAIRTIECRHRRAYVRFDESGATGAAYPVAIEATHGHEPIEVRTVHVATIGILAHLACYIGRVGINQSPFWPSVSDSRRVHPQRGGTE